MLGDLPAPLDPDPDRCIALLAQLPGKIHLVLGNHDRALKRLRKTGQPLLGGRVQFMERSERVEGFYRFKRDGRSCVLNHHPVEDWPGMALHGRGPRPEDPLTGRWHLHGHSHGASRGVPARLDVGWDTNNGILSWESVQELMQIRARILMM